MSDTTPLPSRDDDLDLTLEEAQALMAQGEPVKIVSPPLQWILLTGKDFAVNGASLVEANFEGGGGRDG